MVTAHTWPLLRKYGRLSGNVNANAAVGSVPDASELVQLLPAHLLVPASFVSDSCGATPHDDGVVVQSGKLILKTLLQERSFGFPFYSHWSLGL